MMQNEASNEANALLKSVTGLLPKKRTVKVYAHLFNF